MKFIVRRTSSWGDEIPPCEEAIKESCMQVDLRTCTEKEFDARQLDGANVKWRDRGTNHRKVKYSSNDAKIARDFPSEAWFIEINSLDEIINFYNKYGSIVIEKSWENPDIMQIEIYDDYRE